MGGLEIIIIDGSKTAHGRRGRPNGTDVALATDRKIHPGALVVLSAREMVDCVLARAGRREIHRLIIWGHGCPGVQGIGAGDNFLHLDRIAPRILRVNDHNLLLNRAQLSRLRHKFDHDGIVELHGCQVAQYHEGRELLRQLSDLWGVRVRGALFNQPSDTPNRFFGPVVEAGTNTKRRHARVHLSGAGVPISIPPSDRYAK